MSTSGACEVLGHIPRTRKSIWAALENIIDIFQLLQNANEGVWGTRRETGDYEGTIAGSMKETGNRGRLWRPIKRIVQAYVEDYEGIPCGNCAGSSPRVRVHCALNGLPPQTSLSHLSHWRRVQCDPPSL